mmetsp:Transcript_106260/g.148129  ORF Transcript_106260/g.148129 Transcript_106260/m.148129 type:complete len:143 (-) Transcript_106260:22-450(-)
MSTFPSLKPGAHSVAPSTVKAGGPLGEEPNMMRTGFSSVRSSIAPKHPVETIQEAYIHHNEEMNLAVAASVTGRSLPAHIQAERAELAKMRRLPVLHSSMIALEISLGTESTIEFDDYLNDPAQPEALGSVHAMAEASPYFQ